MEIVRLNDTIKSSKSLRARKVVDLAFKNINYSIVDNKGSNYFILI